MNVDDIVKLALVFAVCFSIIGISYQIIRLLGNLNDALRDLRKPLKVFANMSERIASDYDFIADQIKSLSSAIGGIGRNVIEPLTNLFGFLSKYRRK